LCFGSGLPYRWALSLQATDMQSLVRTLRENRKAVVALWVAVSAPALMASIGLGVQAAQYAVTRSELQVTADAAAVAGALAYGTSSDDQAAANAAANVAEVNGVAGAAARTWTASTGTLADGSITVTIGAGVASAADTSVTVVVSRSIDGAFAILVGGSATQTITATSTADAMPGATGGQPCMLALDTTGSAISMSGAMNVRGTNCTMRSNADVNISGAANINVSGIYAGGSIETSGAIQITGSQNENAGIIADPLLSYAPLQTALASLSGSAGTKYTLSGANTATISPGTYSSIQVSGATHLTLNPGLYVVNGDIQFSGASSVTGVGVTIISSGSINFSGAQQVSLSAPLATATSGVPGVLYASMSSKDSGVSGASSLPLTGLIYTPNAELTFSGASGVNGCTEVVALRLKVSGASGLEANCTAYGLPQYGSVAGSAGARLVR
jgi:hypothetical protein